MQVLVFKTNVNTTGKAKSVLNLFNRQSEIIDWSIDTEDIDKVLRIEALWSMNEKAVIALFRRQGLYCEVLTD